MSCRDPWMELAELVLRNLEDWLLEAETADPLVGRGMVRLTIRGNVTSPVEGFVMRREDLVATLAAARRRIRRMNPRLREIYRLKYRRGMTHLAISDRLRIGERSVDRYVGQIRACIAGTLRRLGPERLGALFALVRATPTL